MPELGMHGSRGGWDSDAPAIPIICLQNDADDDKMLLNNFVWMFRQRVLRAFFQPSDRCALPHFRTEAVHPGQRTDYEQDLYKDDG